MIKYNNTSDWCPWIANCIAECINVHKCYDNNGIIISLSLFLYSYLLLLLLILVIVVALAVEVLHSRLDFVLLYLFNLKVLLCLKLIADQW